jgi:hypothetical protein
MGVAFQDGVVFIVSTDVDESYLTLTCLPLCSEEGIRIVTESIRRLENRTEGYVLMLDPIKDLKINSSTYRKLQGKLRKLDDMLDVNPLYAEYVAFQSRTCTSEKTFFVKHIHSSA